MKVNGKFSLILFLLLFANGSAFGGVYKWVDEKGKVHFSDKPPSDVVAEEQKLSIPKKTGSALVSDKQRQTTRRELLQNESARTVERKPQPAYVKPLKQMTDKCMADYGLTCEEVDRRLQANIEKCLKNRGGDRCNDKDYQDNVLKPRTFEDQAAAARGVQGRLERENRMRQIYRRQSQGY